MIHESVEQMRIKKGVTKSFLANKLGVSLMTYCHIAKGNIRLDVERLKVISEALEVDPGIFFRNELTDSVDSDYSEVSSNETA